MSKLSKNLGLLLGGSLGAVTSWIWSAPNSAVNKKLPEVGIKNVEILPNVRVTRKNKIYHIHHWMFLSIFYIPLLFLRRPIKGKRFVNGFVLGLIAQGLSYDDRLEVRKPHLKEIK